MTKEIAVGEITSVKTLCRNMEAQGCEYSENDILSFHVHLQLIRLVIVSDNLTVFLDFDVL